ncbi:MAG: thiol reductant ABC exporter subunit CydD [Dehalococcoidales bacterium]|nr:thiol reductant ABC exporter subunit CydD [Dehalococcoidales bacterium]
MNLDRRLLAQARAVQIYLALAVGAGLLTGVVVVLQAYLLSRVVGQVFLRGQALAEVQPGLAALLLVIVARAVLTGVRETVAQEAAGRVKAWLRERLFGHLLALGPLYASRERTGELANTAVEGIESLDAYFRQYLPNLALAALVPVTILVFVFPLDFISGLVFLLTAPLIPVFMVLIGKMAEALTKRQWGVLSRMSAHFLDVVQGLPTLKMFGSSQAQARIVADVSDRFRRTTLGVLRVAFLSALALEMLATISTAIVAVQVGLRLLYGLLSFEQAFFVLVLAPEFYLPLRALGASFHAGISGVTAAQRVFAILETPAPVGTKTAPSPGPVLRFPIAFADVHFAYDEGRRPALRGVSLTVEEGEKVSLVGPSGAGKSTVARLLLRFGEPDRGEILVGGPPLREVPPGEWRAQVAWVPQRPHLFPGTVADNIRLARPGASLAEVVEAAALARADEFIRDLPDGYETVVGEQGLRLSGGQAQRLAIARAFLKDAPLLLLDEPTANLDLVEEARLQESLGRLLAGRTALIITHRLDTAARADRVVVLAEGRVVEMGPHRQLAAQEGVYRRLLTTYAGTI